MLSYYWKWFYILVAFIGTFMPNAVLAVTPMTQEKLESVIKEMADASEGQGGVVQFEYSGVLLACISDTQHNRMRIVAPIGEYAGISPQQKDLMLVANFHTALDARYAVSKGMLYAVYIHPLSSLQSSEIASAVRQVATLMQTFGSAYTSGELNFGGAAKSDRKGKIPL